MYFALTLATLLTVLSASCAPTSAPLPSGQTPSPAAAKPDSKVAKPDWEAKWNKVLAAARQEGELLIYFNAPSEARVAIPDTFNKKFGLKLDVISGSAAELNTRLNSEYRAGIHQADLLMVGSTAIWSTVKPNGFLTPIEPIFILPEVSNPQNWLGGKLPFFDKDGQLVAYFSQVIPPIVYNSTLVKEGAITSFLDLLKPEWKGKIVMFDPSIAGAGVFGATVLGNNLGLDQAKEYLGSLLRQQETVVTRDQRQQMEWVAHGKYPVAIWPQTPAVIEFLKVGAPLAAARVKEGAGVSASNGGMAVPARSPHQNAMVVFVNWFLSREGQALAVKTMGAPSTRVDVPPEGVSEIFILKAGEKVSIQNEEFATTQNKWAEEWRRVIASGGR